MFYPNVYKAPPEVYEYVLTEQGAALWATYPAYPNDFIRDAQETAGRLGSSKVKIVTPEGRVLYLGPAKKEGP